VQVAVVLVAGEHQAALTDLLQHVASGVKGGEEDVAQLP
jgi:hypothetical protein